MRRSPIPLTPAEVKVLVQCPLHYHFARQEAERKKKVSVREEIDTLVRETLQYLHAAGGPARLSLADCVVRVAGYPTAVRMVENYYRRLERDWAGMIAGHEPMSLTISISGVALTLNAVVDRLDQTRDGGILAVLFRTESGPPSSPADLYQDLAVTIYHALVASTYPLKRPVRLQELWLQPDQAVTIELSEAEYRRNLGRLREPVQALARGEVMARPGLHCDVCPFKHRGCPVYAYDESEEDEFAPPTSDGKIPPRQWIFKI